MRILAIVAVASAFAFSAAAADQTQGQAKDQAKPTADHTAKPSDLDQIVCHHAQPDTGSNLPGKRICHTKREWEEISNNARQDFEQNMSHNTGSGAH